MIWASQWFTHLWKKERKTPTSLYILNPQPCQIPLKYDSILFHYPFRFLVSFVSASHMIYLQWSHFLPSILFKLPHIHSSMTLTSAPISPFCLNALILPFLPGRVDRSDEADPNLILCVYYSVIVKPHKRHKKIINHHNIFVHYIISVLR